MPIDERNALLQAKYRVTAHLYDLLDFPWECRYRRWRPRLVGDLRGRVLEAGVGTGRNLPYYPEQVDLLGLELSAEMLTHAARRARRARCRVTLVQEDATVMTSIGAAQFDWLVSTFMCCVMPDALQPRAIAQFVRVLKPGGRFRLLEIVYSRDPRLRRQQEWFAPFVERVYGARFDRDTLGHLARADGLRVTRTSFLKDDTYLLIEGERTATPQGYQQVAL